MCLTPNHTRIDDVLQRSQMQVWHDLQGAEWRHTRLSQLILECARRKAPYHRYINICAWEEKRFPHTSGENVRSTLWIILADSNWFSVMKTRSNVTYEFKSPVLIKIPDVFSVVRTTTASLHNAPPPLFIITGKSRVDEDRQKKEGKRKYRG